MLLASKVSFLVDISISNFRLYVTYMTRSFKTDYISVTPSITDLFQLLLSSWNFILLQLLLWLHLLFHPQLHFSCLCIADFIIELFLYSAMLLFHCRVHFSCRFHCTCRVHYVICSLLCSFHLRVVTLYHFICDFH